MYNKIDCVIRGITPTIMHNGKLASPLHPITREMKKLTSKRNKSEQDHELLALLEWVGGLYTTEPIEVEVDAAAGKLTVSCAGEICWPGENLEAMLVAAAKKNKLGQQFKAGVMVDGNWVLTYDGPRDIAKMLGDPRFIDSRPVVVQKQRIIRTRPIFHDWELAFTIQYLPSVVNKSQVIEALDVASKLIGLSDFRPKFGRFEIVSAD